MIGNWKNTDGTKEYEKVEDFPKNCFGFVYKIVHKETGKFYIGKKTLSFVRNKKLGKKEIIALKEERKLLKMRGAVPSKKRVVTESDWKDYFGSSKELITEIKEEGKEKYERIIIQLAYNSKQLTYFETAYQMKENVLQRDTYNHSILGKFHRKDFDIK